MGRVILLLLAALGAVFCLACCVGYTYMAIVAYNGEVTLWAVSAVKTGVLFLLFGAFTFFGALLEEVGF